MGGRIPTKRTAEVKMALNPVTRRVLGTAMRQVMQQQSASAHSINRIGTREVVGFGFNGTPGYVDRVDFPMPGVRFKEVTPDVQALREKELGDWSKLTLEEKKALYRASFCQTFSEMKAPTGEWKSILGISLIAASLSVWVYLWMKMFVYDSLPDTLSDAKKEAQLKRIIDLRGNPVEGTSSNWDYTKGAW